VITYLFIINVRKPILFHIFNYVSIIVQYYVSFPIAFLIISKTCGVFEIAVDITKIHNSRLYEISVFSQSILETEVLQPLHGTEGDVDVPVQEAPVFQKKVNMFDEIRAPPRK
jgi:hypothetical protein